MKRKLNLILIIVLIISCSSSLLAKGKPNKAPISLPSTVDFQLIGKVFNVEPAKMSYFNRFNFTSDELSMVLYFYAVSERPVSDAEIHYIVGNKDWSQLAWYFGVPAITLEDGLLTLRHPSRVRHYPPLGQKEYKYESKGKVEEKVEVGQDKYEYKYKNKPEKIEEKIEITKDKYSYFYKDKNCEEKLEIQYPSNQYEYHYKSWVTGQEIKKEGIGSPLSSKSFYPQLQKEQVSKPELHFTINLNINL